MDRAWRRTNQHLSRKRIWIFMLQCESWFTETNCTSSYIAVWTKWPSDRPQSFENSCGTFGFLSTGMEFVTASIVQETAAIIVIVCFLRTANCNDVEGLLQELGCTVHTTLKNCDFFYVRLNLFSRLCCYVTKYSRVNTDCPLCPHEEAISYSKYGWKICGHLTVTGSLLEMQSGYTKLCCLCEWDSRTKDRHYKIKDWHMPKNSVPGEKCFRNRPIVDKDKILLLPLHIKLGLMKNFVKAMNKEGKDFEFLRDNFPKVGDPKFKKGIFIGPQIREIVNHDLQYKNTCWRKQRNLYGWHYKRFVYISFET